jgi:hypothetical protein
MKNCFIVSFYTPTHESVLVLQNYLDDLNLNFNDSYFFIGLNNSQYTEDSLKMIKKYKNVECGVVTKELQCDSDASGYQLALKLLKDSNKNFDLYWFLHSKAITTNKHNEREFLFNDFVKNKEKIFNLFEENDFIGSYGDMGIKLSTLEKNHKYSTPTRSGNHLEKYYSFKVKTPLEFFCAKTFYVIKGEIINKFISDCNYDFFTKPLNLDNNEKTDRYFFERDFLRIVDKFGFIPLFNKISAGISDNRWGTMSTKESNEDYIKEVSMWIDSNNLKLDKEKVLNTLKEWQRL